MEAKEYRSDIDVLRAIAVISVIFYHMHIPFFSGGYVGVSIFFVISGYLITGIIKRKLARGTFSFLEFYENRIRRILPALLVILAVTMCCYIFLGTQENLHYLMRSAKRAVFGFSNIFFYGNTNYFDPASESIPLLHTWSLGVEEQFYLIMPAFLFLLSRKRKSISFYLAVLFAVSFVSSCILIFYDEKFTFYMLPARAWELLMGSILAYTGWTPAKKHGKAVCILLGLLLMVFSVVCYGSNSYPAFWAFIPCLGAVLYIAGGTGYTFNNKFNIIYFITNNKFLVFIGVISYSLYLWHWTILVFYHHLVLISGEIPYADCVLLGLILVISYCSWRFVEQPVRRHAFFKNRKYLWTVTVIFVAGVLIAASVFRTNARLSFYEYSSADETIVQYNYNSDSPIDFVVAGDSHATANNQLMADLASDYNVHGVYLGLLEVVNSFRYPEIWKEQVNSINKFLSEHPVKNAFIFIRLAQEYNGKMIYYDKNQKEEKFVYLPDPSLSHKEAFMQSLRDTVQLFIKNGVQNVYIQKPLPEPKFNVPQQAAIGKILFSKTEEELNKLINESADEYNERTKELNALLIQLVKEVPQVKLIDPVPVFLSDDKKYFISIKDNILYYYDDDHLSVQGAQRMYSLYKDIFEKISAHSESD